jgi:chromosome segregation ATPase
VQDAAKLEHLATHCGELERQLATLGGERAGLETQLEAAQRSATLAMQQLEALKRQTSGQHVEQRSMRQEFFTTQRERDDERKTNALLAARIVSLEGAVRSAQTQLDAAEDNKSSAVLARNAADTKRSALQRRVDALRSALQQRELHTTQRAASNDTLQAQLSAEVSKSEQLSEQLVAARTTIDALQAQRASDADRDALLKLKLDALKAQVLLHQNDKSSDGKSPKASTLHHQQQQQQEKQLEQAVAELKVLRTEHTKELTASRTTIAQLRTHVQTLQRDAERAALIITERDATIARLQTEVRAMLTQIRELAATVAAREAAATQARDNHDNLKARSSEAKQRLHADAAASTTHIATLEQRIKELQQRCALISAENAVFKSPQQMDAKARYITRQMTLLGEEKRRMRAEKLHMSTKSEQLAKAQESLRFVSGMMNQRLVLQLELLELSPEEIYAASEQMKRRQTQQQLEQQQQQQQSSSAAAAATTASSAASSSALTVAYVNELKQQLQLSYDQLQQTQGSL